MRSISLLAFTSTALGAVVDPRDTTSCSKYRDLANSPATVTSLVNLYAGLIGNYSDDLGQSFLSSSFKDTSDSINALAGIPLGSVTFGSRAAFLANQATQPDITLVVAATSAVTCDTVVIRWTQTFGQNPQPVAGISILVFACEGGEWKLKTLYTEFNSLIYFENIGGTCALPSS